jgi:hypothetical protein
VKRFVSLLAFFLILRLSYAQQNFEWWNNLHGWKTGDRDWPGWMILSPGFLGPNALPVPEVKKGIIDEQTEIEITGSYHFLKGDPTSDASYRIFIPFAYHRVAVEMYGVGIEHYAYSEEIRNSRFSRDEDGKGMIFGDFYFSTLIQLVRNQKFPNTLFRFAAKTATGDLDAARYTDTPGYFFDLSFSKDFRNKKSILWRPYAMLGFYCWQTYDYLNMQNDALLYGFGSDFNKNNLLLSASFSGYSGYKNDGDKPLQFNFNIRKELKNFAIRAQYQHGFRDWNYKTVRLSFILKIEPVKS